MNVIIEPLKSLESFKVITESIQKDITPVLCTGVIDSQKCHLAYSIQETLNRPSIIITHSELHGKEIYEDMRFFLRDKVKYYPSKDIIFYNADVRSINITKQRLNILNSLIKGENITIILSVEALFDRLTPKDIFSKYILELSVADEITIKSLIERLLLMGYERAEIVEGAGQFAVRGGIVDIYTTVYENAIRIEFWGDEIDSIRLLDSFSQRSIEKVEKVEIFPMREFVYNDDDIKNAISEIEKEYNESYKNYVNKNLIEESENLKDTVSEVLEKLKENKGFSGVDKYINFFYKQSVSLFDYLPSDTLVFFDEPSRVAQHAENVLEEFNESIKNRILKGYMLPSQSNMIFSYPEISHFSQRFSRVLFSLLTHNIKEIAIKQVVDFSVKSTIALKQRIDLFLEDLKYYCENGYKIVILSGSSTRGKRLAEEMLQNNISAKFVDSLEGEKLNPSNVIITKGNLNKGFEYQHINLVFITDKELFGDEKKKKKIKKKKGSKIESFTDLKIGDYVVHDNHGIGIYKGIEQIVTDGINKDYLKLQYHDGGILYVHTSQMDMIQKYIGGEGLKIKLNKLSGTEWAKAKAKTRKAVQVLAKDLIDLYAKRQAAVGHIFSKDTVWQKEFEEMFPYEETDDQLTAIEDVKKDMESQKVMDRLICGDVGYGKTEVAIRAAFKAVQDNKQVAYLVPTTILAQQHYNTFVQRMKDFPIGIEMLSRFRTRKQQSESMERLKKGLSDIVIGTHRILSKDLQFKDLGLVIVDEEQRFGVAHKEKLKQLKKNVEVLTLTATPIPRTLHMSLTGIRDISVLEEPPQERQPVQTYVMEYNPEFVKDAINRELAREGQVYYLYNRVKNISDIAAKIQKLVPQANVSYAHGQMSEHELENIMVDFINGDINVLVCTTIIETGLDIRNVNTIIIQDADYMGLSQLYQLRGRVGRSNRQAYAYLMYKRDKVLQENAEKRLQTIREFTEFGSGFKIAMRDMEIRGAGNLLGGEQHGHMDAVGYDMYCKLLDEVVMEMRNQTPPDKFETTIDININAYIPEYYIENEEQKLEIYKKISLIETEQDYFDIQEEIEDRFGTITSSVQNLLEIALVKAYAHKLGILSVNHRGENIIMTFRHNANVDPAKIVDYVSKNRDRLSFAIGINPVLTYKVIKEKGGIDLFKVRELLADINK